MDLKTFFSAIIFLLLLVSLSRLILLILYKYKNWLKWLQLKAIVKSISRSKFLPQFSKSLDEVILALKLLSESKNVTKEIILKRADNLYSKTETEIWRNKMMPYIRKRFTQAFTETSARHSTVRVSNETIREWENAEIALYEDEFRTISAELRPQFYAEVKQIISEMKN